MVYVIDLLSPGDAQTAIAQARRVLRPQGLLCAASLAPGQTPAARLVSRTWTRLWTQAPALVGGCRPISLGPLLDGWDIQHRALVATWGLTSEIVVARPPGSRPPGTPSLGPAAASGRRLSSGDYCGGVLLRPGTLTRVPHCGRVESVERRVTREQPWR